MGKVKVVLIYGYIILRLELCVVDFGIEIVEIIREQMDLEKKNFKFYSDSQIVFGYIINDIR